MTEQPNEIHKLRERHRTPARTPQEAISECPEQPNTNAIIIKTIQGLMTCATNELDKLDVFGATAEITGDYKALKDKALKEIAQLLEDVDMFEKTTLFELQHCFE